MIINELIPNMNIKALYVNTCQLVWAPFVGAYKSFSVLRYFSNYVVVVTFKWRLS